MDGPIEIKIGWEIVYRCEIGAVLAVLVDGEPVSLLMLTKEEVERLCN
jgi:hypothetical protein